MGGERGDWVGGRRAEAVTHVKGKCSFQTKAEIQKEQQSKSLRNLIGKKWRRPVGKWRNTGLSDRNKSCPMRAQRFTHEHMADS